jgi:hypothetical protein
MTEPMSRVQMLQEGWFIKSEPIWISRQFNKKEDLKKIKTV